MPDRVFRDDLMWAWEGRGESWKGGGGGFA